MTISDSLLTRARNAGIQLAEAQRQADAARIEYHSIVRRMHLAGASLREIAQVLELSHQRVQQMVGGAGGSWWNQIWRSRNARRNLACTFCKRSQERVDKLIAGPNVFICDACVALAERSLTARSGLPDALQLAREHTKVRCSFCRKRHAGDRPVLMGAGANICAPCLNVCRQILTDSSA